MQPPQPGELHLDILDVGQGDGMVISLPNGKVMMVDYGTTRKKVLNTLLTHDTFEYFRTHTPFKDKGMSLEWLVLTHADSDHYNIVRNFLTTFEVNVRNVLYGGLPGDYADKLIPWLENRNPDKTKTVVQTATNRNFFPLDTKQSLGAEVMVVACGVEAVRAGRAHQKNTRSVVLRIAYGGMGLLLAGDATEETEKQIIGFIIKAGGNPREILAANVLKVAHHGSRSSSWAGFINAVNPNYAFISSDRTGSLDPDEQEGQGYRLPRALVISKLRKYATRLQQDCSPHSYVMGYQRSDYDDYNRKPEVGNETLDLPEQARDDSSFEWLKVSTREGIFSTLVSMGSEEDPDTDVGCQYRVTLRSDGSFGIYSTAEFEDDYTLLGRSLT